MTDTTTILLAIFPTIGLVTIALINVVAARSAAHYAAEAKQAVNEVASTLEVKSAHTDETLESIKSTAEITHTIVNNDHTILVKRIVALLDKLGEPVSELERLQADRPLVTPIEGEPGGPLNP